MDFPIIDHDFIEHFVANGCQGPNPSQQATNILRYVGDSVRDTGLSIRHVPKDLFAVVGSLNMAAVANLAEDLQNRGWLRVAISRTVDGDAKLNNADLTLAGWDQYEARERGLLAGKHGFLAMKFDDIDLDHFITTIVKPGIKEHVDFELLDARDNARAGIIDNLMRAQIRDSAFVLVDLTHDNSGAYWEAGYAEGLGKPVIYICEQEKFKERQTHFDTYHCTTVQWSYHSGEQFIKQLVATIRRSLDLFEPLSASLNDRR